MKKSVILISDNEQLYKALQRALNAVDSMTILPFTEESLKNKNRVILISIIDNRIHELFYEKIRGGKYLNPVVVMGVDDKESFEKEFPIFNDHPYNHAYIKIPFNLSAFIDILKNMRPISRQAIRRAICGIDAGYRGYLLKLLSHDLLKDKERCVRILDLAGNYLNDNGISQKKKNVIEKIKKEDNWSTIASEMGKELEDRIKGGNDNDKNY